MRPTDPEMNSDSEEDETPTQPRLSMADWVAAVDQHREPVPGRPQPTEWSRRRLGVLICIVALVFPVYSYHVQREIERAEAKAAKEAIEEEMRRIRHELVRTTRSLQNPRASNRRRPPPPVRIVGVIDGAQPTAIAKLHGRSPSEIAPSLCALAERWLRRDLSDQHIRIQEDRGDQPAKNAGVIWCD